jgi:hypothetical protein
MIGKLLSTAVKVATLPVDVMECGLDFLCGGDGSRRQIKNSGTPMPSELRDSVCKVIEEIDGK